MDHATLREVLRELKEGLAAIYADGLVGMYICMGHMQHREKVWNQVYTY